MSTHNVHHTAPITNDVLVAVEEQPQAATPSEILRSEFETSMDAYYPEWKTNMMATHIERLYHFYACGVLGYHPSLVTSAVHVVAKGIVK